eukprot:scaffold925_cov129-Cylindrotheca_fusiformis.AAC.31
MGPPLPPVTCGSSLTKTAPQPKIQIECFLDLICPFSAKMFGTLYEKVIPTLDEEISITIHHVIQPWHPQGTMVHEAALALKQVAPESYPAYVNAIYTAFNGTGKFKDEDTWNKTRLQIYDDLLELIPDGVDQNSVKALLVPTGKGGNEGNAMTQEVKWACKFHRTRGVHVTPTVFVNGVEAGVISSSWTEDDWKKFLEAKGADFFRNE